MSPNILPLCPVCGLPLERSIFGLFDGYDKNVSSPIYYCINGECVEGKARAKVRAYTAWADKVAHQNYINHENRQEKERLRTAALDRLIDAELAKEP